MVPDFGLEVALHAQGTLPVAGVDEVGRGPLAGPVTAAAVVLDPSCIPDGIDDSKRLTAVRRAEIARGIKACAEVSVGHADVDEIESLNILRASHLAMCRALEGLPRRARHVLLDGNSAPRDFAYPCDLVVGGDGSCLSIAAASIIAKVARDAVMAELAADFPAYGWATNAGYGTPAHLAALREHGPTPHHRRTFRPVHNILWQEETISC